ncbi:NUDIX domain-containing protein [Pendulispora brunnea]|uniref:NUDIX domain-containing protein n=1 Tax=Pendulispora brunnea TaxID=2905690 RepID=A0ABZ2K2L2_9BACT
MERISNNVHFVETYQRLARVQLNPRRHTAANALVHSEAVAARAKALAKANGCTEREICLLEDLGRAHDIGKVTGTARPERSLEVLRGCGVSDPEFLALVRWHDTSLPWYRSSTKGQPPSEKAWRRLASEVDLRLLSIFMVSDRVDAPAGWRKNAPTSWFLEQVRTRGWIPDLVLDLPDQPSEISAGGALVHEGEALVIRVRADQYELPKGGIEWDELPSDAAVRETREEAGIESALRVDGELAHVDYVVGDGSRQHVKRVRYFALRAAAPLRFTALSHRTRERRWIAARDVEELPLINDALRPILRAATRA